MNHGELAPQNHVLLLEIRLVQMAQCSTATGVLEMGRHFNASFTFLITTRSALEVQSG